MKRISSNLSFLLALLLVSCGKHAPSPDKDAGHDRAESAANFAEGKGVILSDESWESIGVQTAEVGQRPLFPNLSVKAQVYRSAEEASSINGVDRKGYAYASAAVPMVSADFLKPGARVTVQSPSSPAAKQAARLLRADDALRAATQSVEALLEISDEKQTLPVGTFLTAIFTLEQPRAVTVVPRSALLKAAEGNFVYVKNGKYLLRTEVKIGANDPEWIEIREGVSPGTVIVTRGVEAIWIVELRATKGGGESE